MKGEIDDIYKELIKKGGIDPPSHVWDSISRDLTLENAWSNISSSLELQIIRKFENIGIVVTALALFIGVYIISFPPVSSLDPANDPIVTESIVSTTELDDYAISSGTSNIPEIPGSIKQANPAVTLSDANNTAMPTQHLNEEKGQIHFRSKESNVLYEEGFSDLNLTLVKKPYAITGNTLNSDIAQGDGGMTIIERPTTRKSALFVGITGSLKNTWILNSKTISGFTPGELHSTKAILGREFGIVIGTNLNNRVALIGEYYFTSNFSQAYNEYINGHYVKSTFNVDYNKINLLLGYTVGHSSFSNNSTELILGPYLGFMKKACESVNDVETSLSDSYKNHVIGFTGGLQRIYRMNKVLNLTMGIRVSYGLSNIYKGTSNIPASFRITHPAAISLNMGLRYSPGSK